MNIIGVDYKTTVDIKPVEGKTMVDKLYDKNKDGNVNAELKSNVEKLNSVLKIKNEQAFISKHEVFGDIMIKIVNKDTNEVIFEVPPEKLLDMIAKLCEVTGLKLDKKA